MFRRTTLAFWRALRLTLTTVPSGFKRVLYSSSRVSFKGEALARNKKGSRKLLPNIGMKLLLERFVFFDIFRSSINSLKIVDSSHVESQ